MSTAHPSISMTVEQSIGSTGIRGVMLCRICTRTFTVVRRYDETVEVVSLGGQKLEEHDCSKTLVDYS